MQKRKPTVISQITDELTTTLELRVDGDIQDFSGHFPSFALLPGVTQIDWVMYFAKLTFHLNQEFAGMEVIKFQRPIRPDVLIKLEITWDKARAKLQFKYGDENTVYSSGKIKLGDAQ